MTSTTPTVFWWYQNSPGFVSIGTVQNWEYVNANNDHHVPVLLHVCMPVNLPLDWLSFWPREGEADNTEFWGVSPFSIGLAEELGCPFVEQS